MKFHLIFDLRLYIFQILRQFLRFFVYICMRFGSILEFIAWSYHNLILFWITFLWVLALLTTLMRFFNLFLNILFLLSCIYRFLRSLLARMLILSYLELFSVISMEFSLLIVQTMMIRILVILFFRENSGVFWVFSWKLIRVNVL